MSTSIINGNGSFYVGPNRVQDGLVVHLDVRNPKSYNGSGSTVFDISKEGAVCNLGMTGGFEITPEGIYFDGINANGFIPQPSITFKSGEIIQQWTVGFFIKPEGPNSGWVVTPSSSGADHTIRVASGSGGITVFGVTQSTDVNNRSLNSTTGSVPQDGRWTYVVCTLNDITMRIYINGVINATRVNDTPIANWSNSWRIGARAIFTGFFYRGLLDNFHVYNRTLSDTEIKQNFDAFKGRYSNAIKKD
jgi:hypothetical protein